MRDSHGCVSPGIGLEVGQGLFLGIWKLLHVASITTSRGLEPLEPIGCTYFMHKTGCLEPNTNTRQDSKLGISGPSKVKWSILADKKKLGKLAKFKQPQNECVWNTVLTICKVYKNTEKNLWGNFSLLVFPCVYLGYCLNDFWQFLTIENLPVGASLIFLFACFLPLFLSEPKIRRVSSYGLPHPSVFSGIFTLTLVSEKENSMSQAVLVCVQICYSHVILSKSLSLLKSHPKRK